VDVTDFAHLGVSVDALRCAERPVPLMRAGVPYTGRGHYSTTM
jgi:hypothetical protein